MRFRRLDLIRYGKFTDCSIEFPLGRRDFHLIVGPNEAGKSTLRSAILDLLFAMPLRTTLDFLHPKSQMCLGAAIEGPAGMLDFQRVKANRNSLRTPDGAALPDDALSPFLGIADRAFFGQMFGLDHQRLVEGGNSILSARNDVGQVLFQSASGVATLGKIRDALEHEASGLWGPRKSADREYYRALAELDAATADLKSATVRTRQWAEASETVNALEDELAGARADLAQLQHERRRLERVRRLSPYLEELRATETQLAPLEGVVDLGTAAAASLVQAERELATSRQLLELRTAETMDIRAALDAIHVDAALLDVADDIAALEASRHRYSGHERNLEQRRHEAASLWQEVVEACADLGWAAGTAESLHARLPGLPVRIQIERLARDYGGLAQNLRAAGQARRNKQAEIANLEMQLAHLPVHELKPSLRSALEMAKRSGDPDMAIGKARMASNRAKSALDTAILGLGAWACDLASLVALQPPPPQVVARFISARQVLAADLDSAAKLQRAQAAAVKAMELEVSQYSALHRPVTLDEVLAARAERDDAWHSIQSGRTTLNEGAGAFEAALRHADHIADARLDKVEEASQLQSRQHQLEHDRHVQVELDRQCADLRAALESHDDQWEALVTRAGLGGMPLEYITDWLALRDKALSAAQACDHAVHDLEFVEATVLACRNRLAEALGDGAPDSSAGLAVLCARAEQAILSAETANARRDALQGQLKAAQSAVSALQQEEAAARHDLRQWQDSWKAALLQAGIAGDGALGAVEGALALIARVDEKLGKIRHIRVDGIDMMEAELAAFAAEARRLAASAAPELQALPPAEISQALAQRLSRARAADVEVLRRTEALRSAETQVREAAAAIETANASLMPLMMRAGVDSPELLAQAIIRSDRRRSLESVAAGLRVRIVDDGDGLTRAQIEAENDAADHARLAIALDDISQMVSGAVEKLNQLSVAHAEAQRVLSGIGGGDMAARAESRRQEAIARMSDAAQRYIKVFTAARLLRWSIDRYREEKQGPMLARASAIFAGLTLGSFRKLVVDFDQEPMALEGQRPDGSVVGVSGLSDGTRDQLYLALRLAALELHLGQALPLPFIADDLFVNYDDARAKAGLEALAALSEKTQVIFLSHHDHLVPVARSVFGEQLDVVVL